MFELQYTIQFLKAASADFRFGNGEVFQSEDGTLVSHTKSHVGSIAAPAVLNWFSLIWFPELHYKETSWCHCLYFSMERSYYSYDKETSKVCSAYPHE
jgi:hypothetical protein